MTDIVERLRAVGPDTTVTDILEAADEIDLLRADNARLQKEIRGLMRTLDGFEIIVDTIRVHVNKLRDIIP